MVLMECSKQDLKAPCRIGVPHEQLSQPIYLMREIWCQKEEKGEIRSKYSQLPQEKAFF